MNYSTRILIQKGFNSATTECPKIKLAFWKYLNIALHGFLMGIFNPKLFSPDSSGPHKLKQLLRYGGNKDNKPKWRLLNISAPGWPIWTRTSPMGSILVILYRFRGQPLRWFKMEAAQYLWPLLMNWDQNFIKGDYFGHTLHFHVEWDCVASKEAFWANLQPLINVPIEMLIPFGKITCP